jgi:methionyl-tRNA formyltransferase
MSPGLKIAFAGTPAFAASILETILHKSPHTVTLVYTQQDRPAGRGRKLHKSPVKEIAELHNILVKQPQDKLQLQQDTDMAQVDVMVVAAYGMLVPEAVLHRPHFGCINIHTSLLPRWRGAAPIQRSLLAGDTETGVTIMQMDPGLDTGDILYQQRCQINPTDTAAILFEKLAIIGSECILTTLEQLSNNSLTPVKQPLSGVTYAHKILKPEAEIDWDSPAVEIDRQIRAFNPAPIAYTTLQDHSIRIWTAEILDITTVDTLPGTIIAYSAAGLDITTQDRVIRVQTFQLPGKKVMHCRDFFNGNPRFWTVA